MNGETVKEKSIHIQYESHIYLIKNDSNIYYVLKDKNEKLKGQYITSEKVVDLLNNPELKVAIETRKKIIKNF